MGYLHIVSLLKGLLDGYPVGATRFPTRTGTATWPPDGTQLAVLWRANNDARNFVVPGDPAVRLADDPRSALLGLRTA